VVNLEGLVQTAKESGASDIHLEPGLPVAFRVRGDLRMSGEPVAGGTTMSLARELLGDERWNEFIERRSYDLSKTVRGVRCRVNVLESAAGVGLAIRLFSSFQTTLRSLNLHPDLRKLIAARHGLIIVTGPTGSGKTSTLSALIQEINLSECRHIVTIESPIEYALVPRQSIIRQREVGRHTPSFEQALLDSLREDPDVLLVGEIREPETMRLTLNAAQTGHLVLTSMHSATTAEALQRLVSAFPAETQAGVLSQLADCLVAVIAQQLRYRPAQKTLVPECEILIASSGVKGMIRQGNFYRVPSAIEAGRQEGCWTLAAYREWLDARRDWALPEREPPAPERAPAPEIVLPTLKKAPAPVEKTQPKRASPSSARTEDGVIVIEEDDDDPESILSTFDPKKR
jgi:twitching motility protein PilT